MLSTYSRIGLNQSKLLMRPTFIRGIAKLIPQPPGYIVGTVNDAYVPPPPVKSEGSLHWTAERIVAIGMVPLVLAPLTTGTTTLLDSGMSSLLLFHCFVGFQSCIIDYIPARVYGVYHKYCIWLLMGGTAFAGYGVYQIETKDGGIANILSKIWKQ
ncbi:Succinate dehydrogenase ubiquinone cytochrome b small subunit mitochondrial [Spathaspora sp. JA1]|nr:Succinate dehydrogenase ubiquinone cytochrome b small subunit mitochondrial [Spathaspora sp. JA1]